MNFECSIFGHWRAQSISADDTRTRRSFVQIPFPMGVIPSVAVLQAERGISPRIDCQVVPEIPPAAELRRGSG